MRFLHSRAGCRPTVNAMTEMTSRGELEIRAAAAGFLVELLDHVPEVVLFVKDTAGRYVAVNDTLVRRLGLAGKAELIGRTPRDLFPPPLGERYLAQDLEVCASGRPVVDLLELHLYPGGREGWCLTRKEPVRGADGRVIGLAGISRDVHPPDLGAAALDDLAAAIATLRERFAEPLRVADLAARAGLSPFQLTRRLRALFGLTPAQLLTQTRIEAARRMLQESDVPVAEIALACGYADQSAFTRAFKAVTGAPPARYRERHRG